MRIFFSAKQKTIVQKCKVISEQSASRARPMSDVCPVTHSTSVGCDKAPEPIYMPFGLWIAFG